MSSSGGTTSQPEKAAAPIETDQAHPTKADSNGTGASSRKRSAPEPGDATKPKRPADADAEKIGDLDLLKRLRDADEEGLVGGEKVSQVAAPVREAGGEELPPRKPQIIDSKIRNTAVPHKPRIGPQYQAVVPDWRDPAEQR